MFKVLISCYLIQFFSVASSLPSEKFEDQVEEIFNAYTLTQATEILNRAADNTVDLINEPSSYKKIKISCERAKMLWHYGRNYKDVGRRLRWSVVLEEEKKYLLKVLQLMHVEILRAADLYKKVIENKNYDIDLKNKNDKKEIEDLRHSILLLESWHLLDSYALGSKINRNFIINTLKRLEKTSHENTSKILLADLAWLGIFPEESYSDMPSLQYSNVGIILGSLCKTQQSEKEAEDLWLIYLTNFMQDFRLSDALLLAECYAKENKEKIDSLKMLIALWKFSLENDFTFSLQVKEKIVNFSVGKFYDANDPIAFLASIESNLKSKLRPIDILYNDILSLQNIEDFRSEDLKAWFYELKIEILSILKKNKAVLEESIKASKLFSNRYKKKFIQKAIQEIKNIEQYDKLGALKYLKEIAEISLGSKYGDELIISIASRFAAFGDYMLAIELLTKISFESPMFLESAKSQIQIYTKEFSNFIHGKTQLSRDEVLSFSSPLKNKIKLWERVISESRQEDLYIDIDIFLSSVELLKIQLERVFDRHEEAIELLEISLDRRILKPVKNVKRIYAELLDRTGRRNEARKIFEMIGDVKFFNEIARRELVDYIATSFNSTAWDNELMRSRAREYGANLGNVSKENLDDWVLVSKAFDRSNAFDESILTWSELKKYNNDDGEIIYGYVNSVYKSFYLGNLDIKNTKDLNLILEAVKGARRILATVSNSMSDKSKYWWGQMRVIQFGYLSGHYEGLLERIYHLESIDPSLGSEEVFLKISQIKKDLENIGNMKEK